MGEEGERERERVRERRERMEVVVSPDKETKIPDPKEWGRKMGEGETLKEKSGMTDDLITSRCYLFKLEMIKYLVIDIITIMNSTFSTWSGL